MALFKLGFLHVLPLGIDHVLFIVSLFFLNSTLRSALYQSLSFTVAHSVALFFAAAGFISVSSEIVEPVIAFSIVLTASANLFFNKPNPWRMMVIFVFGLFHGMGFAVVFLEKGYTGSSLLLALLQFNAGVEVAQIAILLALWLFLARWASQKPWYNSHVARPVSILIACIAMVWAAERLI
jgi:hypothetical protein